MTYCVAMRLNSGLIFMSDTRTNAGIDNVSVFRKMFSWSVPDERFITILTAGNLATTQALISLLEERTRTSADRDPELLSVPTMFQAARLVGETLKSVIQSQAMTGQEADSKFDATIIIGGQINGSAPRLFMVYPEGNFVEASEETPFFQIGETKYGRPILLRAFDKDMSFNDAAKLLCVSFDSTLKANLSVGMPLDLLTYEANDFAPRHQMRIDADNSYFATTSNIWRDALQTVLENLPEFEFDPGADR